MCMKPNLRKDVRDWLRRNDVSYLQAYKPLGFRSHQALRQFLSSNTFNRYEDLIVKFEELKEAINEERGGVVIDLPDFEAE